ncbi:MAG: molybdopterin-dependent oxidoreductase [Xanthomonadaceae bacterium]|nr:molybdopterin-dependent oxidoreductase [Xanthomonadaceae bacterium]
MKIPHDSAHTHVSGTSEYIDDRAAHFDEVFIGVVFSTEPHAKILSIDSSKLEKHPDFITLFTYKDLSHNKWGSIFQDQPLIAEEIVQFVGEPVVLIASRDRFSVEALKKLVTIKYQPLKPILSIDDAIKANSYIGDERTIQSGDCEAALQKCDHLISGSVVIRGADHFYLESQAAVAYPLEDNQIEIHSSSQHSVEVQHIVAHALGLDSKDVVCIVKRIGGAFGGKESQAAPFAAFASLVAHKLKRPARLILTKDDDMIMTGKRNPFQNEYVAGFNRDGKIVALKVKLRSDGGAYADLSTAIMERAMLHCDNAYFIPNMLIQGRVCKTHFHPHTAFRGFGGPQAVATIEKIIEQIAKHLDKDPLEIRKTNVYQGNNNVTHYGQPVENNVLPELFDKLETDSDYWNRRKIIKAHNSNRKWNEPLLGLSLTAVKFGISFTTRFLNQGNALVLIHRDGTVQVSTGATEMGQGVNTRIAQLVSEALGISILNTRVMPTRTDKNANTSPTAASAGTDLNGSAAVIATNKIKFRLAQVARNLFVTDPALYASKTGGLGTQAEVEVTELPHQTNPNKEVDTFGIEFKNGKVTDSKTKKSISFESLINEAYLNRVSLSDYGFYRVADLGFNKLTGKGQAFLYFTNGTAVNEVSVSPINGEVKILRTDILMDLGRPINKGLDLGQVTGGFIQGAGWVTTENLYYDSKGKLLSHSPSTYKIPNIQDTPREFNVNLLENLGNDKNVRGTKAVGEPPLLLSIGVWTAVNDAISHLPEYEKKYPSIQLPATAEVCLRAIQPDLFKTVGANK